VWDDANWLEGPAETTQLAENGMEHIPLAASLRYRIGQLWDSPTLRTVSFLAGGNLLGMAVGVIGSLVQARFVSPSDLGYFRGFSIATGYAFFFHLGLLDALQRFYPFYVGRGEKGRAVAVVEVCHVWMACVSAVVSSAFVVLATVSLTSGNWRAMLGWLVQAVAMAGSIYGGYLSATYRSGHDFATVARASIFSSTANLFTLPFFAIWPYVTLAVRSGLGSIVNLVYLHVHRPLRLRWRFSWREWVLLLKHGFAIFIASYGASTLWSVVETTLVLSFLGAQSLGFWSMGFMVLEMANKVPQAITSVYVPRVTECFGRTESVTECMRLCKMPLLWGIPSMILMTAAANLFLPLIVPFLMPNYVGAVPTMCLMMIVLVLIILELPYYLLVAMGKTVQQNIAVYFGFGSFVLLAIASVRLGLGLIGIVGASLVGRMIKIVTIYAFIMYDNRQSADEPILKGS